MWIHLSPTRKCSTLGSHIRRQHIPEKLSMYLFIPEDLPRGWRHSHSKDKHSTSYYLSCCRTVSLPCPSVVSGELHSSLSEVPLHFLLPLLHQMLLATPLEVHVPNLLCVFHEQLVQTGYDLLSPHLLLQRRSLRHQLKKQRKILKILVQVESYEYSITDWNFKSQLPCSALF